MGVTDHSEYVGVTKQANTPGSAVSKMPEAQGLIIHDQNNPAQVQAAFLYLLSLASSSSCQGLHDTRGGRHDLEGKR